MYVCIVHHAHQVAHNTSIHRSRVPLPGYTRRETGLEHIYSRLYNCLKYVDAALHTYVRTHIRTYQTNPSLDCITAIQYIHCTFSLSFSMLIRRSEMELFSVLNISMQSCSWDFILTNSAKGTVSQGAGWPCHRFCPCCIVSLSFLPATTNPSSCSLERNMTTYT